MRESGMTVRVGAPGVYRIVVRWTPYWHASSGCVSAGKDGMIRLHASAAGAVRMTFRVSAGRMLSEIAGSQPKACS
jgi:hypothetical protein